MNYVYIFEDGSIGVTSNEPTDTDKECVADGLLQILAVHGTVRELMPDGLLHNLQECSLRKSTVEGASGKFHTL